MEMETSSPHAPLLQSLDDRSVLQLEPLRDVFMARELEQRRLNKMQESIWIASIVKDIKSDEHATAVVRCWLNVVASSEQHEFRHCVPQLTDEVTKLFVQFFWFIKVEDLLNAKKLLLDARRNWGIVPYINKFKSTARRRREIVGDLYRSSPLGIQAPGSMSEEVGPSTIREVGGVQRLASTLKMTTGRKRNIPRHTASAITKRSVAAHSKFKKKCRLNAKGRLSPGGTNSAANHGERVKGNEVALNGVVGDGLVGVALGRQRSAQGSKRTHDDTKSYKRGMRTALSDRSDGAKRPNRKKGTGELRRLYGRSVIRSKERDSATRGLCLPQLPQHANGREQVANLPPGAELSASPSSMTEAKGHTPKKTNVTMKSTRKWRPFARRAFASRLIDTVKTPSVVSGAGAIAELDRGVAHIGAMACEYHVGDDVSAPVYTFDNAGGEVFDDVDDGLRDVMPTVTVTVGSERGSGVAVSYRPPLPIKPPIWAQSRQEVCESLDSFRSFQGGVYHSNEIVKGYLLGAHSSSRDLFHHGGKLIISHGGGKAQALHSKNGRLEVQGPGDQLEDDRSVRALLNNYRAGRPLVLLADDNYALFPFDLTARGYTYVVLGLYWIAHAWAELQQVDDNLGVVRYKFAFQWCTGQGDPWWVPGIERVTTITQAKNSEIHEDVPGAMSENRGQLSPIGEDDAKAPEIFCSWCQMGSPLVYQHTPMCLQPSCSQFWRVSTRNAVTHDTECSAPPAQNLSYNTDILRLRPAKHLPASPESLYPPFPGDRSTTPRPFAKGMHCRDCGRLSTRFKWEHLECSHCHRIYDTPRFLFSHKDFWLQEQTLKFYQHRVAEDSGIVVRNMEFRSRRDSSALPYVQTFDLPNNRGRINLISGHPSINGSANALFRKYQEQAACGEIQFRRWPLRTHKCRGQLLSNYFSQNTGAPYQYIGGAERTTPLEEGATAVLGALDLIKHRIATSMGIDAPFNEVLSAAYMERQRMAFHSDSERGLGPIVASLSLGSVAEMHFRLHAKYTVTEGNRKVAMSLVLRHGDVLVMEGAGVQEYYEHAVVPKNFRIVATARFISPENYTT